ncbi:MAG: SHOCT domain-containing protein [Bacillota bacterium]
MLSKKFKKVVKEGLINQVCEIGGDKPNVDFSTAGGKTWWNNLAVADGWKIQQNKLTKHCRLLNPQNTRKAWGSRSSIESAVNTVYNRISKKDNQQSTSSSNNKEEVLSTLERLGELRDKEIITETEFQEKKKKLLAQL